MAIRRTTHVLKNSDVVNRPLPSTLKAGEPIVNTADGIMWFSGVTTSTSEWTPAGTGATANFFEVGSNLYDLRLRNRLTEYEGASGAGLVGKFLSGTTSGFVLADISSIAGVDTFLTAYTYDNANTFTINRNDGTSFNATINVVTGLTVNGTLSATTLDGGTILSGGTNLNDIFSKNDFYTTGSTLIGSTVYFNRNDTLSAYTLDLSTFAPTGDTFTTGYTYDPATNTFTIDINNGTSLDANFNAVSGLTVNGDFEVTGTTTVCDILPQMTWNVSGGCDIGAVGSRFRRIYARRLLLGTSTTSLLDDGTDFTISGTNGDFIFIPVSTGDTVFHSDVLPDADLTRDLGIVGQRWKEVNAGDVIATAITISSLGAGRVVYTNGSGGLTTEAGFEYNDSTDTILVGNLNTSATGSAFIGTGGLIVGSGGNPSTPGTGDVVIHGNLTVFGDAITASTGELYVEDNQITLNYNPTGDTSATSIGSGWLIQDGNGSGTDINFDVRAMNGFTGLTASEVPDISEYTGSTGFENRAWVTQLNDIVLRSNDVTTPDGVRVLTEFDCLDGGSY